MGTYARFISMIITSTVIMFGLMYLNTYSSDHLFWSETRSYMAFIMGATMAVVMLLFMWGMYKSLWLNLTILIVSVAVFAMALYLVRSQTTVSDMSYMRAMIPHHSIAIMTSERANIEDIRVRELANGIIKAQRKEIEEMKWLLNDIDQNGKAMTVDEAERRKIPTIEGEVNPAGIDDVQNSIYLEKNQ